ncbi:ornithine cyclodeaminase [Sphingopyxis panaciterrae]|uniref:ornithine cyclodeaminase family protein n=1 Tax=Sphingopyxis panaciterrae TaxID=363841 RepID=UPI0014214A3D|nr:ornithine cyclodeaminase family protein [Sphingopyxis panaciterrae]NIJ37186.1 ornithine cyclodeaminase [Sphingopyxis panaciterrae]
MNFIDAETVRANLSMPQCIDAMATAMKAVSQRELAMPSRIIMPLVDGSGYFGVMPGSLDSPRVYGAKIVSLHPANPAAGRPAIQGFVALFDHDTGTPFAIVDGAEITTLRTAAASGLATRTLARPDAKSLGLFGYGVQAEAHLDAVRAVRPIEQVRVWGRSLERAQEFARKHGRRTGIDVVAVADPQAAAACDIVCTITGAHEPILSGAWIGPGTHVNLVGAHAPTAREADTALIRAARVYTDALESLFAEGGDILVPIAEGAIDRGHVRGEIGDVLLGRIAGRGHDREVTVYKSLGVVAQDIVAAEYVVRQLNSANAGT